MTADPPIIWASSIIQINHRIGINNLIIFLSRPSICIITSFILLIQITAQGQQCDEGRNTPKFARTYIVAYDGPFDSFGVVRSNETVSMTLGGCRTFDDHVDKIIEHFQTRYNIDINHIRSDPLARYEDDEFIIAQNSATSENRDVVIAGTVNRDGRYLNIPLFWNFWSLIAKKDMSTRQGIVNAGNWLEYGMFR